MKALKIIGGILLLLIIAFFLIGVINPTSTYENTITINKPVDQVWEVFMDPGTMDQWLVGMQSIETLEGEPMEEGSRYRLVFVMEGERIEVTEHVEEVRENELFAFSLESDPLTSEVEIQFIPVDSTVTRVQALTVAEGKGMLWKPVISLSGSMMQQQSQQSYDKLKQLVESWSDSSGVSVPTE